MYLLKNIIYLKSKTASPNEFIAEIRFERALDYILSIYGVWLNLNQALHLTVTLMLNKNIAHIGQTNDFLNGILFTSIYIYIYI